MLNTFLRRVVGSLAFATALTYAGSAVAEFPERSLRMVVPFSPGGGTDMIARALGAEMAKELGQPIVIENKPGAGTMIGTDNIAKSPADGYSLLIASFAHAINPSLQPQLPFGSNDAFAPVALIARGPNVLVVRAESPYNSLEDLLAAAKANPGHLTYASQGVGTSAHLAGEMFSNLADVKLTHVPYRGAGPALTDLLGGHVDMMFATAAAVSTYSNGEKLRMLGVTTTQPSHAFKDVPPISDSVPGYRVESWYGIYVPAETPPAIIDRLHEAAVKASRSAAFSEKLEHEGLVISAGTPQELEDYVKNEEKLWATIVKENGISPN